MPTLLEYFQNDFKDLSLDATITVTFKEIDQTNNALSDHSIQVFQRLRHSSDSSARLFTYYVPETFATLFVCQTILNDLEKFKKEADGLIAIGGFTGDQSVGAHSTVYSNRIFFYTESQLTLQDLSVIDKQGKEKGLYLTFRSQDYVQKKMEIQKPLAFISHDSQDKEFIARPIANGLSSRLCYVWYDEFSLQVGDSLRESIEKGIKEAKKCVLILTPHFLKNPGWGKKEFNSIFTREMILNERVVIPIWHKVTAKDVYEYSPALADTFALTWPSPEGKPEAQFKAEVELILSKIHTSVTQ